MEQVGLDEKFGMHIFGFAVAEGLVVHCYHIQRAKTCVLPVLTSSFVQSRQSGRAFLIDSCVIGPIRANLERLF